MDDAQPPTPYQALNSEQYIRPAPEYCVRKEPIPSWVKQVSLPEGPSKYSSILEDLQIDRASKTIYQRYSQRIEHKIDAMFKGNMSISFNPYFQKLILHSCEITRTGKTVDRLNQAKIFVAQTESDSDSLIFRGDMQAFIFLDDVNEDDILEYSYSIVGHPFDLWGFKWPLQVGASVQKLNLRIIKNPNHPCRLHLGNKVDNLEMTETEDEIEITLAPCPALKDDAEQGDISYIEFTEFDSWNAVAQDGLKHYPLDPDFALNAEALKLIQIWKNNSFDIEEAAVKALRFVQDEIRYLALSHNDGGWTPASSSETLKRRYGDCKAKTQLFRSFLNLLSIPSSPVLVHTKQKEEIECDLPISISNHVIVRIDLEDGPIYVDPTQMFQGGPLREAYLPYQKGLVLSEKTQELSTIESQRAEIDQDRTTTFSIIANGVAMTRSFSYYGKNANAFREDIALLGKRKWAKSAKRHFENIYGPAKLISYEIIDSREANHIKGSYTLELEDPWSLDGEEESYFPYWAGFISYFDQDFDPERKTTLKLPEPTKIREKVIVTSGCMDSVPIKIEHPAFDFTVEAFSEGKVDFEFNGKLDRLEADELENYASELYRGKLSSYVFIYKHTKEARKALQIAKILGKP